MWIIKALEFKQWRVRSTCVKRRTVMFRARAEYDGPSLGIFESHKNFFFFFDREV